MRSKRAMAAVLGLVAAVSVATAAPGAAQGRDYQPFGADKAVERQQQDFQANTTNGESFLEVNAAGNLVYWRRTADGYTFYSQVRGWGWGGTRIVSTLNADTFVEVKGDGRLSKWTWDGYNYHEQVVGWGWQNARLLSGVSWDKFVEINQQGNLVLWQFDAANNLSSTTIGWGWGGTRLITGLADLDFLEVKGNGLVSEWLDQGAGLEEFPLTGADFSTVRLMAGMDINHFLLIDGYDGSLWEATYNESDYTWYPVQRGWGWNGTRLIG
ncbi:hypothetical protein [Saccharothrix hoggarensis]|uniref:Tachylectin n=1 Tax=Saccharothrix hoggarensis TaxID=913853 RepID=A0ABW3QXY7_9PSEU